MNCLHNSSQPLGTCRGTALLQLFNIVNEKQTGITGINNVETSPALVDPHFSSLPINSKSLLMKNTVAPNLGGSLIQCFSRLSKGIVFTFLRGEGKIEKLPCMEILGDKILNGFNKLMPTAEKDDQEITRVEDAVPSQISIFNFLNGDFCQLLIFLMDFDLGSGEMDHHDPNSYGSLYKHLSLLDLSSSFDESLRLDKPRHSIQDNESSSTTSHELRLTDLYAKVHDDVEWMITDAIVKDDGFSGEIVENILYLPFHHWHKMFKNDPLPDLVLEKKVASPHQCYGSENVSGIMSKLNCDAGIFGQIFKFGLEIYGFVIGNYHEETVARIPMLLSSSGKGSPISNQAQVDEENFKNSDSTLSLPQCSDDLSDTESEWITEIHDNTTSHFGNTDSSNDCETSGQSSSEVFGTLEQHPAIGNTEELKFSIPDPDELMKYLYGSISSPKFFASDLSNGESDNFHLSSHFGNRNSDEVAKSDNLSDSITNESGENSKIDNEYGFIDSFGFANEPKIGAMTGAFGETETPDKPSLPDTSDIEKIRLNWCSRDVDSSLFNLSDHHDLLELYGLNEQDVNAVDDYLCDSPTWSEKQHIQDSELCYIKSTSTSTHHHSFDTMSDPRSECTMEIHNKITSHFGNTDSSNNCGTSSYTSSEEFGTLEQHSDIGTTEEWKFSIPDPNELMNYLYGTVSSPRFLASDPSNGKSDNFHDSSSFEIHNLYEVAKLNNLSDLIANSSRVSGENDNEYGMFDTFGYATESGIGATSGAFGELETSSIPSLPDTSQIEKILWNWSSQEVDSSAFDFGDHQNLLELYGLSELDVQVNDDEFCDSPTWPGKP